MKKVFMAISLMVVFILVFCAGAGAETYTLEELADQLSAIEVEGFDYNAKYYENSNLFTYSMKSTVITPEVWAFMDGKALQEHYLSYIEAAIQLEDMIHDGGYSNVAIVTTFQLADNSAIYMTINGIDCSRMVHG